MLNSKDIRYSKSLAMTIDPIFQIGKEGISANLIQQLDDALEARELIKITVLRNAEITTKQAGEELATELKASLVQVIGKKIILFRPSEKKPRIRLPFDKP